MREIYEAMANRIRGIEIPVGALADRGGEAGPDTIPQDIRRAAALLDGLVGIRDVLSEALRRPGSHAEGTGQVRSYRDAAARGEIAALALERLDDLGRGAKERVAADVRELSGTLDHLIASTRHSEKKIAERLHNARGERRRQYSEALELARAESADLEARFQEAAAMDEIHSAA